MYKEFSMVLSTLNYNTLVRNEQAHNLCKKSCTNYVDNDILYIPYTQETFKIYTMNTQCMIK